MSEPPLPPSISPSPSPSPHLHRHNYHLQQQHQQSNVVTTTSSSSSPMREYRKGNWTIPETLILITAKKLDEERRTTKPSSSSPQDPLTSSNTKGELRWKWVENYCWIHGCFRSQNQCNDKWDNLLRDYKKVREYENRVQSQNEELPSYWNIEKHDRKFKNLPSNMDFEVFQALDQVLQKKYGAPQILLTQPIQPVSVVPLPAPPQSSSPAPLPPLPAPARSSPAVSESRSESSGTKSNKKEEEREKKRRKNQNNNIGSSIMQAASVLAQTLRNNEEMKQKRHREVMELEQRRVQIEEARNQVNMEGIANLVSAATNLSGAIHSLISGHNQPPSSNP